MDMILEILGKVGFDWRAALFQFINFLVVFFILKKFAFAPIMAAIDKRQALVKEGVEQAEKAKTELVMSQQKAQSLVDESKVEANRLIEAAQSQAQANADKSRDKAKAEIEGLVTQAKKNIEAEKEDMRAELKSHTASLVVAAVTKVVGDKLTESADQAYIEEVVTSLKN